MLTPNEMYMMTLYLSQVSFFTVLHADEGDVPQGLVVQAGGRVRGLDDVGVM